MPDINNLNASAQEYFNSLPPLIKEQIMQSGLELASKEELEGYYQNILRSGPNTVKPEL